MGRPVACLDIPKRCGVSLSRALTGRSAGSLMLALLVFLGACTWTFAEEAPASFVSRTWLTEHGLPQNTVNALAQTRDGFLWVGTNGGLARFDGVRFRHFGLQDGLSSVRVSSLAEDSTGSLWVGTTGGGVSRWEKGRFTAFRGGEGFPTVGDILAIAVDRNGGVWFGTSDSLVLWRDGVFRIVGEMEGMPSKQILALTVDSAGAVWAAVLGEGVMKWNGSRFEKPGSGARPADAYSLTADSEGSVWAGYGNGEVWQWKGDAWKKFAVADGLPNARFTAIAVDDHDRVWVGSQGKGIYRKEGDRFVSIAGENESEAQTVRALLVDRHGAIWAGSATGGLSRYTKRVVEFVEVAAPVGMAGVSTATQDASGKIWLITYSAGIQTLEGGKLTKVESPAIPRGFLAYCGIAESNGTVWAGGEQLLLEFRNGEPAKPYAEPPIRGEALRALCVDGDSLWIGTYHSALLRKDADGVHSIANRNSFGGSITTILTESPGVLWIGSYGGLFRWERGVTQSWGERDGLITKSVLAMQRESDGTLWIGTLGGGLARMKNGKFAHITTRQGLADDVISQIVKDDLGCLWLGSNRGIMRVDRGELEAVADGKATDVHPMIIDRNEGMLAEQCVSGRSPLALKSREGLLYFPTVRGVAIIDPRNFESTDARTPTQPRIEEFRVDNRLLEAGAEPELGPGPHRIEVSYTAPVLHGGEWVRFRHRLEGIDRDWVITNGQRRASYDALPPGRYVFSVSAADGRGGWGSSVASMAFIVQPHFWQTLWFRGGGVLLLAGSAMGVAWGYLRSKHRRHIEAIERERAQHAQFAHAGRVARLGELSASIAHELKQPLAAILSNAQAGLRFLESGGVGEIHDILRDIADADRRASEIIGRMRDMVKKGEAQLEARDLNADLHQVLMLIRSDLVARNVSVSIELAPGLPLIRGDHIQLQQVLLNLIMNGCDAMHAVPVDERRLKIETARDGGDFARVSIVDYGSGISPDMLDRIFDPFFSTKSQGLGMGLSICRAIVNAHGGRLWAENNPKRGATFHFTVRLGEERRGDSAAIV